MTTQLEQVKKFRETFGLAVNSKPTLIGDSASTLHFKLLREEVFEYFDAAEKKDLTEIADALTDIAYVLCGAILQHGLQDKFEALFTEVHASNMSKLDENGNPIYDANGKVMKGANYFKPNLSKIIAENL